MKTEKRKPQRQRSRYLTPEEEMRLLAALPAKYRDPIAFAVDTGGRIREILGLQWADLIHHPNLDRVTFWRTKTRRARTVPLTARAQEILARAKEAGAHRPFVVGYWALHRAFTIAAERAGINSPGQEERIVIHSTRHTFASRLVQNGYALPKVQLALGHSQLGMTMRYAHLSPAALDDMTDFLGRDREKAG